MYTYGKAYFEEYYFYSHEPMNFYFIISSKVKVKHGIS